MSLDITVCALRFIHRVVVIVAKVFRYTFILTRPLGTADMNCELCEIT